ncbi:MAG: AAA family ATPase [archaeon]|jgi:dCMP deaminase
MIIGITGFLASGKGAVSELLKAKGFTVYSCSDEIREECRKSNVEITRENLQRVGNELRQKFGPNVLAKRLADRITLQGLDKNYVVESIRTEGEIEELKKLPNFNLVSVEADSKIRYERAKLRLREKEQISSYEEFMASEKKELTSNDPNSQNLEKCKQLAEYKLNNDGPLDILGSQVEDLLLKIQIKNRNKPSWDEYFIRITDVVSRRESCLCVNFGAVIVKDNVIKSTGYVGAPRGTKDCFEKGYCLRRKLEIPSGHRFELCTSVHAEQNAIINAARDGVSIVGGTMYIVGKRTYQGIVSPTNSLPCFICKKMIINAGIIRVVCSMPDGSYKSYNVSDWVEDWKKNDIIDDKEKYGTSYK